MWLQENDMPPELRPDRSHVVLWVTKEGTLIASVDQKYPNAYREGEMGRLLQVLLQTENAKIGIIVGESRFPLEPELSHMSFTSVDGVDMGGIDLAMGNLSLPLKREQ